MVIGDQLRRSIDMVPDKRRHLDDRSGWAVSSWRGGPPQQTARANEPPFFTWGKNQTKTGGTPPEGGGGQRHLWIVRLADGCVGLCHPRLLGRLTESPWDGRGALTRQAASSPIRLEFHHHDHCRSPLIPPPCTMPRPCTRKCRGGMGPGVGRAPGRQGAPAT